jgi:3-oxoacyl-[acyl-carrier protein] reductase
MIIKSNNKLALVTGSSKGIGLSIAKQLDKNGVKVILNSRSSINKKILKEFKNDPLHFKFDITNLKKLELSYKKIKKKYGNIDYLICNVGFSSSPKQKQFEISEWKKIFEQNFFSTLGTIFLFKKIFNNPKLKKKIICISSVSGSYVSAAPATYAISKSALNNFVKHISKLLTKDNIILNCVAPGNIFFKGGVWDKMLKKNRPYYKKYISSEVPEKRLGTPDEIAGLVTYLCSDNSTFINGAVINIDGGQNKSL